jgi:hypothetical protein
METIQAKLEIRGNRIRVRVATWPEGRDLLRAMLCASPRHPRAVMDLLEAIARWEGRTVHAAVVADGSGCSCLSGVFPDLLPETTPLVQCDYVGRRSAPVRDRGVLRLRGRGRDEPPAVSAVEPCLPFPTCKGVGR